MTSEHLFYASCPAAPEGQTHAVRIVLDGTKVVHLSSECPLDAAADAAERLGTRMWCCHAVEHVRNYLQGGGFDPADTIARALLGPVSAAAHKVREEKPTTWDYSTLK